VAICPQKKKESPCKTEEEEDPLMTFLQGRKPENMTLNERRDILKAILVAQPTAILHATLLGTGSDGKALLKELLTTAGPAPLYKFIGCSWTVTVVARWMAKLDALLGLSDKLRRDSTGGRKTKAKDEHLALKAFQAFVAKCKERMKSDGVKDALAVGSKAKRTQAGRRPIQEKEKWDETKRDIRPCLGCNHVYCMVLGESDKDTIDASGQLRQIYSSELAIWQKENARTCKAKPKAPKTVDANIACMCSKMYCMNRGDGSRCPGCVASVLKGLPPVINEDGICQCAVCLCECVLFYSRGQKAKIALEIEIEKEEAPATNVDDRKDGTYETGRHQTWLVHYLTFLHFRCG
jgi:hypothetical protein